LTADELQTEVRRLTADLAATNAARMAALDRCIELEAQLATARAEALEEAARHFEATLPVAPEWVAARLRALATAPAATPELRSMTVKEWAFGATAKPPPTATPGVCVTCGGDGINHLTSPRRGYIEVECRDCAGSGKAVRR
jgi:hypothetical protein